MEKIQRPLISLRMTREQEDSFSIGTKLTLVIMLVALKYPVTIIIVFYHVQKLTSFMPREEMSISVEVRIF